MDTQTTINEYAALIQQVEASVPEDLVGVVVQQMGKDRRMKAMQESRGNGNGFANGMTNGDKPATENQIRYLLRLGETVPSDITKARASQLIDEAKRRNDE